MMDQSQRLKRSKRSGGSPDSSLKLVYDNQCLDADHSSTVEQQPKIFGSQPFERVLRQHIKHTKADRLHWLGLRLDHAVLSLGSQSGSESGHPRVKPPTQLNGVRRKIIIVRGGPFTVWMERSGVKIQRPARVTHRQTGRAVSPGLPQPPSCDSGGAPAQITKAINNTFFPFLQKLAQFAIITSPDREALQPAPT